MLSHEVMGLSCLGVLWTTALLVAAAAWQDLRDVLSWLARARRAIRATVDSCDGATLAEWWVAQRGRALDTKDDAIAFHDRSYHSRVGSGVVAAGGRRYRVDGPGEVWMTRAQRAAAARAGGGFDGAYAKAVRAAGFEREVRASIRTGDEVFVLGQVDGDSIDGRGALVVATFDPSWELARAAALIVGFVVVELAACAAVTWLSVAPPQLGPRSVVGAVLGLGFFLGVTPVAVALREHVRRPGEARVRGVWRRSPAAAGRMAG